MGCHVMLGIRNMVGQFSLPMAIILGMLCCACNRGTICRTSREARVGPFRSQKRVERPSIDDVRTEGVEGEEGDLAPKMHIMRDCIDSMGEICQMLGKLQT